jgi:hypothetical protein
MLIENYEHLILLEIVWKTVQRQLLQILIRPFIWRMGTYNFLLQLNPLSFTQEKSYKNLNYWEH